MAEKRSGRRGERGRGNGNERVYPREEEKREKNTESRRTGRKARKEYKEQGTGRKAKKEEGQGRRYVHEARKSLERS